MKITSAILVFAVAIGSSHGKQPSKFPDIFGPIRTMFGRGPSSDLKNSAATNGGKPYQGNNGAYDEDQGFRPMYEGHQGSSYEHPKESPFAEGYYAAGSGPFGGASPSNSGPPSSSSSNYPRRPPGRHNGPRHTRQEPGGFGGNPYQHQSGPYRGNGGGPPQGSFNDFGSFGGNSGGGPDFGQSFEQPSSSHHGGSHGPQSYHHGPPARDPPRYRPQHGPRPPVLQSNYNYRPQTSSSSHFAQGPSPYFGGGGGPGGSDYSNSREPQIITMDDLRKPSSSSSSSSTQFGDLFNAGESNEGPSFDTNGGFYASGGPPGLVNSYSTSSPSPYYPYSQGSPSPYSSRPSNPTSSSSSQQPGYFQNGAPGGVNYASSEDFPFTKPFGDFPKSSPTQGSSGYRAQASTYPGINEEEVLYGRPMLMSASDKVARKIKRPPGRHHRGRRNHGAKREIVKLSSPRDPSYSASNISPMVYDPQTAASEYGSDHSYGLSPNGDRITYHVVGHKGPSSYRFGYDTGKGYNRQFRVEEKDGDGHVKGHYGFVDKKGKVNIVHYQADKHNGFSAHKGHKGHHHHDHHYKHH